MAKRTLELLETLMAGNEPKTSDLDTLLNDQIPEDLYLDYKHGDELKDHKKGNATVRQYVSAFANSDGGVLLIGIDEKTWTVTGCTAPGGGSLTEWASRCLTNLAPYLAPPPRFYQIAHPKGDVLVIATARTPALVPVIEASELVYYFRFHDQTLDNKNLKAPDYLLRDILLGRRQRPDLHLANFRLLNLAERGDRTKYEADIQFQADIHVENRSLLWAEDVRVGVVAWAKAPEPFQNRISVGEQLRLYIDVQSIDQSVYSGPQILVHYFVPNISTTITPLGVGDLSQIPFTLPHVVDHRLLPAYTWKAAIYILAKNSTPVWYQVNFRVDTDLVNNVIPMREPLTSPGRFLTVVRFSEERPIVAWENSLT